MAPGRRWHRHQSVLEVALNQFEWSSASERIAALQVGPEATALGRAWPPTLNPKDLMQLQAIIEFLLSATLLAAVLGYLGRKAIEAYLAGRVEAYKGELQRVNAEHGVRFQRLHAERAEVIKDFYAKLAILDETLGSTLAPFQHANGNTLPDKVGALSQQFNETREYFLPRRIFFDEPTCELVDKVVLLARGIFYDITTYEVDPQHPQYKYHPDILKERHEFWEKARGSHANEFASLKRKLEHEFRKLLGIGV